SSATHRSREDTTRSPWYADGESLEHEGSDDKGGTTMKIVVMGGNGLIGKKLVSRLRASGNDAVAPSPSSGVDVLTGAGLADVLKGAQVLVDVTNSPSFEDTAVLNFFVTAARNLLPAEAAAGVGHHVALSVVGADHSPHSGYMRAKVAQEKAIKEAT